MSSEHKNQTDAELHALWDEVMTILKTGQNTIRPRQKILWLMDQDVDKKSKLYMQSFLGICAIGRLRPGKAMGTMARYRNVCKRQDRMPEFDAFVDLFKSYLHPVALTPHGYHENTFANLDASEIAADVDAALQMLNEDGFEAFINSGTLLGMVRDGSFLPHDDDIDLGVLLKANDPVRAAREWKFVARSLKARGLLDGMTNDDRGILKLITKTGVQFDLFPAWIDDNDMVSVYPYSAAAVHKSDLLPLKPTGPFDLMGPANPDPILAVNYGPGWKVPDPYYTYQMGKQDVVFEDYLRTCREAHPGPRTVITYGTFDLFHAGHVRLLERLAKLGERLVVGLSTDEFNALKDKKAVCSYEDRKEVLEACSFVDLVIPEETWDQKRSDVIEHKADLFAMGDDWTGKFDDLKDLCDVTYLPRTENISTTDLRQRVKSAGEAKAAKT
ncbi:adenylyltransferase/cytidyltransferase family protein [Pseudooctadecabacter jejudonensis]|uniref:Glycerol-3-phosphate cytidylyltransferase n=1 Tax=Pseudooctadecabacter jejudonensis TaxID=1391910 RepID=A0A1Y5RYS2_9RHOB|nr:adenylyltransferase/cytidyltransferase family protein [Pseudooctadecabacter jejudonensis]SLN28709.1 Glycerol-3-phosphate cytidylyltransferase [Pseudooctadecabacter jejudonensis]